MAILLQVGTEVFNYPENGTNIQEQWGEEASAWAKAVTDLLASVQGPNDVAIATYSLLNNQPTALPIIGLRFTASAVQHIYVEFVVQRVVGLVTSAVESGFIVGNYNGSAASGQKFVISQQSVGSSGITIDIQDDGQFTYTSTDIPGSSNTIKFKGNAISY